MRLLLLLVFLALPMLSGADGCYFAKHNLTPQIAYQRSAIAFRNGEQRMVIQNTVNSTDPDVSWVVPLPSRPTKVEEVSSGFYRMAEFRYRPHIAPGHSGMGGTFPLLLFAPLIYIGLTAPFRLRQSNHPAKTFLFEILAVILIMMLLLVAFPVFASPSSRSATDSVVSLSSHDVGNYRVEVLRTPGAQPLMAWLEKNRTPLPATAKPIIDDYVQEGWVFMVAKLKLPNSPKTATPHPIGVTFPTRKPIYPMRLTGLVAEPIVLDLFVIADGTASSSLLETWVSVKSTETEPSDSTDLVRLSDMEWPGSAITRLRAAVKPSQMKTDIGVEIGPFVPHRKEVWTSRLAREEATSRIFGLAALISILGPFVGFALKVDPARSVLLTLSAILISITIDTWVFLSSISISA